MARRGRKNSRKCGAGASGARINCARTGRDQPNTPRTQLWLLKTNQQEPISEANTSEYDFSTENADSECAHATVASHYDTLKVLPYKQTKLRSNPAL